jgi:hypothetical protein
MARKLRDRKVVYPASKLAGDPFLVTDDPWSHEETDDAGFADRRNFYKFEK